MSPPRRIVWAGLAVLVAVVAVVAGILLTGGGPEKKANDKGDVALTEPAVPPEPADEEPLPDAAPKAKPEITPQATGLKEEKVPEVKSDEEWQGVPPEAGGCDRDYGGATQCVPWTFPDGITEYADKCLWLKLNAFADLKVNGTDRQKLDPDGDKIACNG